MRRIVKNAQGAGDGEGLRPGAIRRYRAASAVLKMWRERSLADDSAAHLKRRKGRRAAPARRRRSNPLRTVLCLLGMHSDDRKLIWRKNKGRKSRARYLCTACGKEFESRG